MLEELKKKLGVKESVAVEMEALKASYETLQAEMNVKLEELAQVVAEAGVLKDEKASLEAALADAVEKLAAAEEFNKAMAEKAMAEKLSARKQKIADVIGEAKADATFEAVKNLSDSEFAAVVDAFAASVKVESSAQLFTEVGASVEVQSSQVEEETLEAKIIKERFAKK